MTRDDIIELTIEAGLYSGNPRTPGTEAMIVKRLQRFAELVAAAERDPELVRDAERYRWLRTYNTAKHPDVTEAFFLGDENLDAEIDAAIAAEKGGA
jgi:alpha-beta hydrolase superfamily lysophospholipase